MLQLRDIVKNYPTATTTVQALRGVNLAFRQSEFVAILGPSGCGKTTMLNLIGGLDRYTSGDLIISGVSTAEFDDEHWDAYRNATIGFVFQSYNLISHLTVLENVELALALSGEKKKSRRAKAIVALNRVGMGDEINKRPNQLSGGQMQRVAIARAIVNNPKIILADEPTGALDSELSVQVMDILAEIANDRLVIMVTHNNELAQTYCTRICRFKDGQLIEDTNPYVQEDVDLEEIESNEAVLSICDEKKELDIAHVDDDLIKNTQNDEPAKKQKKLSNHKRKEAMKNLGEEAKAAFEKLGLNRAKKRKFHRNKNFKPTSMSLGMAFSLSLRNLWAKRKRTFFTAFAGSIGIIGLALVLSISNGFDVFVRGMQTEMLAGVPVGIYEYNVEINVLNTMLQDFMGESSEQTPSVPLGDDFTIKDSTSSTIFDEMIGEMMGSFFESVTTNDMTEEFATYMRQMDKEDYGALSVVYGTRYNLISKKGDVYLDVSQAPSATTPIATATTVLGSSGGGLQSKYWNMLVGNEEHMLQYYELVGEGSRYPTSKNQILLSVTKDNQLDKEMLDAFGIEYDESKQSFSSSDFIGKTIKLVPNNAYYFKENATDKFYKTPEEAIFTGSTQSWRYTNQATLERMYNDSTALELQIVGILREKQGKSASYVGSALCYTQELANWVVDNAHQSDVAMLQRQLTEERLEGNLDVNVFGAVVPDDVMVGSNGNSDNVSLTSIVSALTATNYYKAIGASHNPTYISAYPNTYEQKEAITEHINNYTDGQIAYFDVSEMFVFYLNMIIDLVSVILIAVASISLVVSTVMIGVITSNSVIERTREIGILRSLGARKIDIRHVFIAETSLIGLFSGLLGIVVAYILCPLVSLIIQTVTGVASLLRFHPLHATLLVALSFVLTIISGVIPAVSASRKNVVEALRVD